MEFSGAGGIPPSGWMTLGSEVGMTAALVEDDPEVGAVEVAVMILESGIKVVMESVPVGLTVFVGGAEVVGRVVIGSVLVKFPANAGGVGVSVGVSVGSVSGVIVGVVLIGGGVDVVSVLLLPTSTLGVTVGVVVIGGSVGPSVGVVVGVVVIGGSVMTVGVVVGVVVIGLSVGVSIGGVVGVVVTSVGVTVGVAVGVVVMGLLPSVSDAVLSSVRDWVCEAVLLEVSGGGVIVGLAVVSTDAEVVVGSNRSEPVGRLADDVSVEVRASSALLASEAIEGAAAWAEESAEDIEARSEELAVDATD